uniref:DNA translocase FtsK-like n=1 Tax=Gasterosteus aculeatus aculeatus TaxID=481459 RepID=UPI001A97ECA5|nr:DNA translocase FtsK-like [Gasterosteus aculeatus aculeatus]
MIILILSWFTIMVSAVPLPQGGATQALEATNQGLDTQTPAPLSPNVVQPQPGVSYQLGPQGGPQFLPPTQHYWWPSLGGSPRIIPLQPSIYGSQPADQPTLPQQPSIFPPYRYVPLLSSPYGNQLFSPYGFPMIVESLLPQTPGNPPPISPVLPAGTPSGAAPLGDVPQLVQQQQSPQIVYMFQQPKETLLSSLSSEELQTAVKMSQLGVYLTTLLTNPPAGAIQPVSQGAGLVNPQQQVVVPTSGTLSAGVQQTQGPAGSAPQPNTNGFPSGLERPPQEAATVKAPVQPTEGKRVCNCSNRQRELTAHL